MTPIQHILGKWLVRGPQPGQSDVYDRLVIVCLQVLAISNNASLHARPVPTALLHLTAAATLIISDKTFTIILVFDTSVITWMWQHILRIATVSYHHHNNRFTALFQGPPTWADARRELLDFMVHGKIDRGRHKDHPAGRHSIQSNQCPPPPSPIFLQARCLSCHPTVSKHWRQPLQ